MFFEWLDLVQSNAHRWRRVRIDFPQPTHISKFDSFTKPMPFLEHLVISTSDLAGLDGYMVNTDWESNPKRFYFQGCPNLHTLASHATLMVPATTLRRLKCLHFGVRGLNSDAPLWAALAMTPALEELHMYYPFRSRSSLLAEPPSNPVSLPALRRLGLLGFYHFEHKRWDKYLNVPNVDTLVVSVEPLNHLRDVFATFSPSVRHLILTTVEPQGEGGAFFSYDDATALDGLQRIETLELRDITPSMLQQEPQVFFGSLAGIGDNRDGPVPKWGPTLRKLIFRDCEVNLGDCASLVSLVHMRVTAVQDNVEDAFELQLINTRFLKGPWGEVPGLMGPVKHLFESSIVERRHPSEDAYYDNFEDLLEDVDYQHLSDAEYNEDGKPDATFEDAGPQPDGLSLETSEEQYVEQFGADSPKKHLSP
ncbi:hypothetical protein BKA62DRAFT_711647 [Auriculariales sp. MPI-PUGE-AT-0066]|nr:hypothetical protein BKA62DRAFT_711647 [Auriculariales sp. MPI-PUGE-AT-0066]